MDFTHTHTQPFYGPFSGTTRVSRRQKKSSGTLYCKGRYQKQTSDHTAGHPSIWTNQRPTSIIPHFYAGCTSCRYPPTLSWLGTGTKYAGLHTQWRSIMDFNKATNNGVAAEPYGNHLHLASDRQRREHRNTNFLQVGSSSDAQPTALKH